MIAFHHNLKLEAKHTIQQVAFRAFRKVFLGCLPQGIGHPALEEREGIIIHTRTVAVRLLQGEMVSLRIRSILPHWKWS